MRNYLYMVLGAISLGSVGVIVKLIGSNVHFMTLNFYRIFFAFIFLLATVPYIDKTALKPKKKDIPGYFVIGLLLALALSTFTTAIVFTKVQNAILIRYTYPFVVMILAYFFLKEKITMTKVVTLLIAVIGLTIINPFNFEGNNLGNIIAFVSSLFYAILLIGMRMEDMNHSIGDVIWFFFFASLLLLPFPFIYGWGDWNLVWLLIILLGTVTGIGHLFYNLALEKIEAETCSIIATIVAPFVAILLAVVIINEAIDVRVVIGGVLLIIAGLYLETHSKSKKIKG